MGNKKRSGKKPCYSSLTGELLYGIQPVKEALVCQKRQIFYLYLKHGGKSPSTPSSERLEELARLAKKANIPVNRMDNRQMDQLVGGVLHQGSILSCGPVPYGDAHLLADPTPTEHRLFVALDQVEDPHNMGAIIRSSAFFHASGVIVPMNHSAPLTPTVSKSSAGVLEYFPVIGVPNLARFLEQQKKKGYWIVGLDADTEECISSLKWDRSYILVVGNEGKGMRQLVHATCDWHLSIAGNSEVSSLNVSNATAVALFQLTQHPAN
ncbi:MAG: 23S rRNA (guanosine(2251)-2'-O)-methyltransferase RlmB [SAR324 cluster bacterium]|nr:23S rRNA (guanosine(2251)-2'-O)-methyltransferase RlmB [SAR324 cluster bacterium]